MNLGTGSIPVQYRWRTSHYCESLHLIPQTTTEQPPHPMTDRHPMEGLLIDPDSEDVRLFLEAIENGKVSNDIHTISNGTEALDFLHQRNEYTDAPRPNLILLDI